MKNVTAAAFYALVLVAGSAHGGVLYSESFDYGPTGSGINGVGGWTSSSAVLVYDPTTNLSPPGLSNTSGGSMWLDFNLARTATDGTINIDMSGYGSGDEFWFATAFQYVSGNTSHDLTFTGGSVTAVGFRIDGSGDVSILASDNGGASNTWHSTGVTSVTDGTYLMLARGTLGNTFDASGVTNSVVDFWFNPSDTSSVGALGAASWTTGADSKFGRASQSITGVLAQPSQQGRIDEIRAATSLQEVVTLVPEPHPAILGGAGLALLMMLRRRWR